MRYIMNISLDRGLKQDYYTIEKSENDENVLRIYIYTNGESVLDFKKMSYITFNKNSKQNEDVIKAFKSKRGFRNNTNQVYVSLAESKLDYENTKEQNEFLANFLRRNSVLLKKRVFVDIGSPKYDKEGVDLVSPFKGMSSVLVSIEDQQFYCTADEITATYELVNAIMKKLEGHELFTFEKMLYAFDIIRTNFAFDEKYSKLVDKVLRCYDDPSTLYTIMYKLVLDRLNVSNLYSVATFQTSDFGNYERGINIAYVDDQDAGVNGIYFFDLAHKSKYSFNKTFPGNTDRGLYLENYINNYAAFCKTKGFMIDELSLEYESLLDEADEHLVSTIELDIQENGMKGFLSNSFLLNTIARLVDGEVLFNPKKKFSKSELDEIGMNIERFADLFGRDINGETFLDALFNVRKLEYISNRRLFPLDDKNLRECMLNSSFTFSTLIENSDLSEYEFVDLFEDVFSDTMEKQGYEKEIKKLHLIMKQEETPKDDDK